MNADNSLVHSMTRMVLEAIESGKNPQVLVDLRRICGEEAESKWVPKSPKEIAGRIFCVSAHVLYHTSTSK